MGSTRVQIGPTGPSGRAVINGDPADDFSRAQILMWSGQQLDPELPLYNMIETYRIEGSIDPDLFGRAWADLVTSSDALRTTVVEVDGRPHRVDLGPLSPGIDVVDLRNEPDPEAAAAAWVDGRRSRALDLSVRLWDTALLQVGDDVTIWYLCVHHLVSDGQTFLVIFREVAERYRLAERGELDRAEAPVPYRDYVEYERSARQSKGWAKADAHWRSVIAEPTDPLEMYGCSSTARSAVTERLVVDLDQERSDRVRALSQTETFASLTSELSRHAVWATVLAATLHRIAGAEAIRIGSPYLGRPTAAFRNAIGLFIDIGALTTNVETDDTFLDVGQRVLTSTVEGLLNARPGISSADINRSYSVLLNSVTSRFEPFAGRPVTTEWVHSGYGDPSHGLRLQVCDFDDTGRYSLLFDVNTDLLGPQQRAWLADHFQIMLDACLDDPARTVGSVDLLAEDQRSRLLAFNETATTPPSVTVVDLFARRVAARPDAIAVEDDEGTVSYRQLADLARTVTETLRADGIGPGDHVALCARRGRHLIAGLLGVLGSAAAYVPIDPVFPPRRRAAILDDAEARILLVAGVDLEDQEIPETTSVVDLGELLAEPSTAVTPPPAPTGPELHPGRAGEPALDDRAYLIYTSGSTGTPKGAMLTHRGLANYVTWAASVYQGDEPLDFPFYSSISFDLTVTSVFVPLISGGRVVTYDHAGSGAGLEILDVMAEDRVDVVKLTPAHLAMVLEQGGTPPVRIGRLILGGEILRIDLAARASIWFGPRLRVFNEYGPTEAVVGCMIHEFDAERDQGAAVPVGRPAANVTIEVLDAGGAPVPPGVVGELVISGPGVAQGYWKRPDLTAEKFVDGRLGTGSRSYRTGDLARWTAEGELDFLGRRDGQVKIRGARVELGEVEAVLADHPAVGEVVVDVIEGTSGPGGPHAPVEHCAACGLRSDHPGAAIDDVGRCRDCRDYQRYRSEVERYWRTPADLRADLAEARRRSTAGEQDCIILASGGKDSTYMLYQLVREFGVRPLVFTLDNGFLSESALENVRSACADLGLELYEASTPHMNAIFVDSLERHANVCDGCFKTVYTLSMSLARERGIPTIITGLARGQLFETRLADTFEAREFDPDRIDRWITEARKAYHHIDDAVYQLLEQDLFVDDDIFDQIGFVDFYRYVDVDLTEVYRYLENETVWSRPPDTGRSTNCLINDVGIFVHKQVTGHHNYALPYSWDVRLGHKRREQAMAELDDDIDITRVRQILDEIGFDRSLAEGRVDRRLAAYYTLGGVDDGTAAVDSAELRRYLTERLPDFMVPRHLVAIPAIPLTVNGKVDRARLPDPGTARPELDSAYVAPRNATERRLADIWARVLPVPEVGVDDNFFDLGGDSISAIQIASLASEQGLTMTARDIFADQTVAVLAGREPTADVAGGPEPPDGGESGSADLDLLASVPAVDRDRVGAAMADLGGPDAIEDLYPLSPTQLGMVYHSLGSRSGGTYVGQGVGRLVGAIDVDRLQRAWIDVVRRHPATRARLVISGLDQPVQLVVREPNLRWDHHDWTGRPSERRAADRDRLMARLRSEGFELEGGPLMSLVLLTDDTGADLVWTAHHASLDGWSAQLLLSEALERYADGSGVAVEAVPADDGLRFGDHVRHLLAADPEPARRWWSDHLAGIETTTPLPIGNDLGRTATHDRLTRKLSADDTAGLDRFLRANRLTLGTLANGAWGQVVGHYAGADDVVFGSTVSGRDRTVVDPERCVGLFISTVPTRIRLDHSADPATWLRRVQADLLQAREHDNLSLAEIQDLASVAGSGPLFDSIVVVENYPVLPAGADRLAGPMLVDSPSNFPVALLIHPNDELEIEIVFDRERVDEGTAARFASHLTQAMLGLTRSATVGGHELIGRAEAEIIEGWERGPAWIAEAPAALIHHRILDVAERTPGAIAIETADGSLTYRQLVDRAVAVAGELVERGVEPGRAVGILAGDGTGTFVGVLAVLLAGGVYVAVDPELPSERLAHQLAEAGVGLVLVDGDERLPAALDLALDLIVVGSTVPTGAPLTDPVARAGSDPAYIIYTSGSTAQPKGVVVSHANLAWSTGVRTEVYGGDPEAFLLLSSLAFDSSMVGLFWTLASGGRLVVPAGGARRSVGQICDLLGRRSVSHLLALPSLYGLLLDEARADQLATLDTVIVAGEACPGAVIEQHRRRLGHARLFNEYGPTEATVWSHAARLDVQPEGDESVRAAAVGSPPIGRPVPGATGAVLDHRGRRCGIGVPGQLHLSGPGITAGYLDSPDATAAAFVVDPGPALAGRRDVAGGPARWYRTGDLVRWRPDGQLDFLGRTDNQIKLRGHRIELGEVEAALLAVPGVTEAVAVVDEGGTGDDPRRLVAYYRSDAPLAPAGLRGLLAERLPRAMVPSILVPVTDLPRTATGKVDRSALVVPEEAEAGVRVDTGAMDGLQATVAGVWSDVLDRVAIGPDSDFFDLGGNSLDAMRMLARLERRTGRALPLEALLRSSTVGGVAELLRTDDAVTGTGPLVPIAGSGSKRPFFYVAPYEISIVEVARLGRHVDPDRPFYGLQPSGLGIGETIDETIEAMAARYVDEIRAVQPRGPYHLGGHCEGGLIAIEMARLLWDRGQTVGYLGMADVPPPPAARETITDPTRNRLGRLRYYAADGRLFHAVRWQARLWAENTILFRFGRPEWRRIREVRAAHAEAFDRYRFRPDPRSPLHLIRSTELATLMDELPWYGELTVGNDAVTVTDIESTHARLLLEPETAVLAETLSHGLDEADRRLVAP